MNFQIMVNINPPIPQRIGSFTTYKRDNPGGHLMPLQDCSEDIISQNEEYYIEGRAPKFIVDYMTDKSLQCANNKDLNLDGTEKGIQGFIVPCDPLLIQSCADADEINEYW